MRTIRARQTSIGRRQTPGFTMVEIALCLAIVSIALVALLGVLPTGLTVQRNNRDDTIILQEGTFLIEAIRGGSRGMPQLTNYVDFIGITNLNNKIPPLVNKIPPFFATQFHSSDDVIGLLSTPEYMYVGSILTSNTVTAKFRAISGNVSEKGKTTNAIAFAFTYIVNSEVVPYSAFPAAMTNWTASSLSTADLTARKNAWQHQVNLGQNLYEVRLTLRWPVRPDGSVGMNSQTFRTLASGSLNLNDSRTNTYYNIRDYYYFLPSQYGY